MVFDEIIKYWQKISSDFVKSEYQFLEELDPFLNKLREERQKYNEDHFNIFSLISELYRPRENVYEKENPNSEVLKLFLDPNTKDIGNEIVLRKFIKFIGLEDCKKVFPKIEKVKVEREKHRIDIYLHDDKNAIIIESKLYGAPNQDFQLARYYLKAKEDGYNVKKIIYLTLNPVQELDLYDLYKPSEEKKYSMEDQEQFCKIVPELEPLIEYVSAVTTNERKNLSTFFDSCSKLVENNILKLLLHEYSKLLIKLAGEQKMTSAEKELIKKIYESKESIKNALDFESAWKDKDEALIEIFIEKFKIAKSDWIYEDDCFYKEINGYWLFIYEKKPQLGFWSEKFKKQDRTKLREVLENLDIGKLRLEDEVKDEENWVYMNFVYDNEPIDEYFEMIIKVLDKLEKEVLDL